MKKISYLLFVLALIFSNIKYVLTNNKQICDLTLKNIECLATPEYPTPNCEGVGSLDCPNHYIKVRFRYYADI